MNRLSCTLFAALVCLAPLSAQEPASGPPSPEQAWERLKQGNERFATKRLRARNDAQRRTATAKKQKPFAAVLACADSRTGPELVFDQGLGDLFVVRVAGNVTDPVVLGSLEYAVGHLHTPLVVVLGHEHCGAVAGALAGGRAEGNLGKLLQRVDVGRDRPKDKQAALAQAIRVNARHQAAELTRQSTLLRDAVKTGRVRIVTGIHDLETGRVRWLASPNRPAPGKPE